MQAAVSSDRKGFIAAEVSCRHMRAHLLDEADSRADKPGEENFRRLAAPCPPKDRQTAARQG